MIVGCLICWLSWSGWLSVYYAKCVMWNDGVPLWWWWLFCWLWLVDCMNVNTW